MPPPYRDAVAAYQDLIARRTRLQGEDHTTTLTSMSNYTERLLRLGKPEAALPWARQVFERRSALYGPDHSATLTARGRPLQTLSTLPAPPTQEIRELAEEMQRYAASAASTMEPTRLGSLATAGEMLRRSGHPESGDRP